MTAGPTETWPWSALGIAETLDKNAIHAAYAARKATIDGESSPISAFAQLTEAREKALFIASEIQRSIDRGESTVPDAHPAPLSPAPAPPPPPPPPALPEPDAATTAEMQTDRGVFESPWVSSRNSETSDTSSPDAFVENIEPDKSTHEDAHVLHLPPLHQRQRSDLTWLGVIPVLFAAAAFLFFLRPDRPRTGAEIVIVRDGPDPTQGRSAEELAALDRVSADLFGEDVRFRDVADVKPYFGGELAKEVLNNPEDPHAGRSLVRYRLMRLREDLNKRDLISVSRLYLDWLKAAQGLGGDWCREVTGTSFFEGVPEVSGEVLDREREIAWKLTKRRYIVIGSQEMSEPDDTIPDWVFDDISASGGPDRAIIEEALADEAHPQRCSATIALVEAMLAREDAIPMPALAKL